MREVIIDKNSAGQRLDKFCLRYLGKPPKSFVFKMIRKKNISVNGKKADEAYMLAVGDIVRFFISNDTILQFAQEEKVYPKGHVDVIFEDDDILIANKPAGLLTQPNETGGDSLIGRVINYQLSVISCFEPVAINRLDRNTSGIVICAKNLPAAQRLSEMMRNRLIGKVYLGVAHGRIDEEMILTGLHFKNIESNVAKIVNKTSHQVRGDRCRGEQCSPTIAGKEVLTSIAPIAYVGDTTALKIHLHTGRSHQIRAHLQSIGHPLVGDKKYGGGRGDCPAHLGTVPGKRQLLHAWQVNIAVSGDSPQVRGTVPYQTFTAPIPPDMLEYFKGAKL